jgi:hypothetical protein
MLSAASRLELKRLATVKKQQLEKRSIVVLLDVFMIYPCCIFISKASVLTG